MENQKGAPQQSMWQRIWNNYVIRNIILAGSLLVITLFVMTILLNFFTRHNSYKHVPDFINITLEEAQRLAKKDRLNIEINDSLYIPSSDPGIILEQRPVAGTEVKPGRRIYVTINSSQQKLTDVPYVTGYSLRQAKNILETAGLEIERLIYINDIATNNILEQKAGNKTITANKTIQAYVGSGITLTVGKSSGNEMTSIPRVVGLPLREAKSRIWEAGLNVGKVNMEEGIDHRTIRQARVYRQTPDQGRRTGLGTEVSIYLSLDSLTVASGISSSDKQGGRAAARERALRDSLIDAGFSGDKLKEELDWAIRIENGEVSYNDRINAEDLIQQSLENYGDESSEEDDFFQH